MGEEEGKEGEGEEPVDKGLLRLCFDALECKCRLQVKMTACLKIHVFLQLFVNNKME